MNSSRKTSNVRLVTATARRVPVAGRSNSEMRCSMMWSFQASRSEGVSLSPSSAIARRYFSFTSSSFGSGCNKAPQPYQRALFLTSLPSSSWTLLFKGPAALPAEGDTSGACGCRRGPSLQSGFDSRPCLTSPQEDCAPRRMGGAGYASVKGPDAMLGRSGTRGMRFVVAPSASGEDVEAKRTSIYKSETVTLTTNRLGCSIRRGQGRGFDLAQHTAGDPDAGGHLKRRKGAVSAPFPKVCVGQLRRNMFGSTRALFSYLSCSSQSLQKVQNSHRGHTQAKGSFLTRLQREHHDHTPQMLQRGAPGASTPVPCYAQVPQ